MSLCHNIDSDHLCYICLASFTSPANLFPESQYLVPEVLLFKLVQKTCTKESFFTFYRIKHQ